ncbi:MAG: serine/threonine protein kinase [Paracoccaceae bacterium]|nr:serine/threonine protein kinase [Paracoccaceae bacterium]MDH5528855.1 serine/threonine protein kinase [Paracoccaceae bacterium]
MGQENLAAAEQPDVGFVDELEPGTELMNGQYTITRFLNNGGFGITYLAKDSLDRDVVIKECFPNAFCRRSRTLVAARSRAHQGELRSVVKLFVQEARNLSKLVHTNIVGVHQVFEDNDTAYMAIDYIKGRDLLQLIEDKTVTLHPEHIVQIAEKMISAIGFVHDNSVLHRDISPDNILLTEEGEPILIDFGAAREQASRKSRALTALRVVKDGYSPQEFYIAGSEQGPWSDLYALGATLYHLISGEAPINGQARLSALAEGRPDPYNPLVGRISGYPDGFLEAIDKAMQALPRNRVQTAREWLDLYKNPKPKQILVDGEPELVIANLIAASDNIDIPATDTPASKKPAAIVTEAPAKPKPRSDLAERFADLSIPQNSGEFEEADAETTEPEEYVANPAPVRMPKLATQQEIEPASPAKSRSLLLSVTATVVAVSAGLVAFVYLGTASTDEPVVTSQSVEIQVDTDVLLTPVQPNVLGVAAVAEEPVEEEQALSAQDSTVSASSRPKLKPVVGAEVQPIEAKVPDQPTFANVLANQIGFAVWDLQLPFEEDTWKNGDVPVSVITRIRGDADVPGADSWMKPGSMIYSVNGQSLTRGATAASVALNNISVDPDGFARSSVQYKEAGSGKFGDGLITSKALRRVQLVNGTQFEIKVVEGKWQTSVTGIADPVAGGLRQGDILFRAKTVDALIDDQMTLESVVVAATIEKFAAIEFSVLRNNTLARAIMPLALEQ